MSTMNILIVEDEPLLGMELSEVLQKSGYNPLPVVSSGNEVLMAVKTHRPDLIMMDIHIRGSLDGIEAARQLHREFDIPLIFLTAFADKATLDRAASVKPDGYLIKPYNETELVANIVLALEKRRLRRDGGVILANYVPVIDALQSPMFLFDPDGRLFHLNVAACQVISYPDIDGCAGLQLEDIAALQGSEMAGLWPVHRPLENGVRAHIRVERLQGKMNICHGLLAVLEIDHTDISAEI